MQETPNKFSLDLDHDLDRSLEEDQDSTYKRDSNIGQFNFQHDQDHHFNQVPTSNPMLGDSHLSQEGVFSYNDDYRMRQSMKSEQEFELEDIGGNADMSDRRTSVINEQKNDSQFSGIKIVQKYESKQDTAEFQQQQASQRQEIEKTQKVQVHQIKQQQQKQQKDKTLQQEQIIQSEQQQQTQQQPKYSLNQREQSQKKEKLSLEQENQQQKPGGISLQQTQQINKIKIEKQQQELKILSEQSVVQNQQQQPIIQQNHTHQSQKQQSSVLSTLSRVQNTFSQQLSQLQKTPQKKKSIQQLQQQTNTDPIQLWSNQSNKSFSPIPQQKSPIKSQQNSPLKLNQQSPIKLKTIQTNTKQQEVPTQKPKITLLKESLITQQKSTPTSSIRDWFRPSINAANKINQQKPSKQYNPNQNQIPSPVKQHKQSDQKEKYRQQMQAQMQGFQQSLSQFQKNNNNKSQTNKQRQKANKTHLPQTTPKNIFNTQNYPASQDLRMLLKICVQKKKQNYVMLREWDKKRAQTMNLHRNLIQMLQNEIDKRIKSSLQNFEIYSNFFKQKLKQQEKFSNSPVINTKYALQNNAISKNIYINCSVILNSLSEQNQSRCKKVQDFIGLIKNDILKDLIESHMHDSQRQLLKVREKISTLKSSLKKYNQETEEKSQELGRLFSQATALHSVRGNSDFYSFQLQFLRSASQQVFIQKRLGENCLQYYHTSLNEQFKRAKVVRQALLTYSKGLKQTYNIVLQQVGLQQLSKTEEIKLIEEFYSLDQMIDQRTGQMLKQKFNLPLHEDLTIKQVTKFIETFQYDSFNNRMLLLKQFSAKYYASVNKDFKTPRQQNCHLVITVDFHLHLFFSPDMSSLKPDISLKITPKQLQIKPQKQQFIDIIKKQQKRPSMISYFWDSKNQKVYRFKFPSKDHKELFYDYLNKLLS